MKTSKIFNLVLSATTAFSNQYKCGVFFIDLKGYQEHLAWIGGLPDVLAKKAVKDSAELRQSFGNVDRKDFVLRSEQCGNVLANARCYAVVSTSITFFCLLYYWQTFPRNHRFKNNCIGSCIYHNLG
jgi:hypothetical protein